MDYSGKLVFFKKGYKNEGKKEEVLSLSSDVPVLEVPSPHFWWDWILSLILLIILLFIVKFVLRRVFLFDLHLPSPLYKETEKEGFSYLLLDTSYAREKFLSKHLIDLKEEIRTGEDIWYKKFIAKTYLDNHTDIVIDNFDYQWDDPLRNFEKLEFLEKLFTCNKIVIIVSGVHPDNFKISAESFTENQARETVGKQGKIFLSNFRERWQNIFQTFPVSYSHHRGNPEDFWKEIGMDLKDRKRTFDCFSGTHSCFLDPYGNVYPCISLERRYGNIRTEAFDALWRSPSADETRRSISRRECQCCSFCDIPLSLQRSWRPVPEEPEEHRAVSPQPFPPLTVRAFSVKVLITHPFYWPYVRRGAERYVHELAEYLSCHGDRPHVVTSKPGRSRTIARKDVTVHYCRQLNSPLLRGKPAMFDLSPCVGIAFSRQLSAKI